MIFVGGVGFVLILLGNAAAYGIIAIAGVQFNHTMLQALPFLALGLGVDDLFLLLHAFRQVMSDHKGSRRYAAEQACVPNARCPGGNEGRKGEAPPT